MSLVLMLQPLLFHLMEVLQRNSTPDLLQLAMNSSRHTVAEAAAHSLPARREPQLRRKLLITAAKRRHASAAIHLLRFEAAQQQHMDSATLEVVLSLLAAFGTRRSRQVDQQLARMWHLLRPAAEGLGSGVVLQLLHAAVRHKSFQYSGLLLELPASQQSSVSVVEQLLQAAVPQQRHGGSVACARLLLGLPAAQQLSTAGVLQQLQYTLEYGAVGSDPGNDLGSHLRYSCNIPAAQELRPECVLQLLHMSVRRDLWNGVDAFRRLPAAQQLSSKDMVGLLEACLHS